LLKEFGPKIIPYDLCTFNSFSIFPTKTISYIKACDKCHRTNTLGIEFVFIKAHDGVVG
jgi:hypothetical protein